MKMGKSAKDEAPTATIAKAGRASSWMKPRGWLSVTNAMKKFIMKNKNGRGKGVTSLIQHQKNQSQKSTTKQEAKVQMNQREPVTFKIAGAEMSIGHDLKINGEFHKISYELWQAIIGFHRQISIDLDGESVTYHKWNDNLKEYITIIPWQKTTKHGLHVDVNWLDPRNQELLDEFGKRFGEEFFPACTIHTHVDSSAFESGTDAKDEKDNPGWHITLGNLISAKKEYHFDFRMRLPQTKKLKEVADTGAKIKLAIQHVVSGTKEERNEMFVGNPGTTDWHHLIERVETK
jgi:hypothetical protein